MTVNEISLKLTAITSSTSFLKMKAVQNLSINDLRRQMNDFGANFSANHRIQMLDTKKRIYRQGMSL